MNRTLTYTVLYIPLLRAIKSPADVWFVQIHVLSILDFRSSMHKKYSLPLCLQRDAEVGYFFSLERGKSTQNQSQNPVSGNYLGFDFRLSVKPSPWFHIVGFFLCKQQLLVLLSQNRIFLPYQMIERAGLCKETPHKQKSLV